MTGAAWTPEELERIGQAEELEMAPLRADGTARRPVPIWVGAQARATTPKLVPRDGEARP